jgi:O-antigen ligase
MTGSGALPRMSRLSGAGRPPRFALLILGVPILWILGLDQAAWLAAGVALGGVAFASPRPGLRWFVIAGALFMGGMVVSGVLGAQGSRWITFARDLLITGAFLLAVAGTATVVRRSDWLRWLVTSIAVVVAVSVIASLIAFVLRDPLAFRTPIADWVPEVIASTRLGQVSLVERVLGTLDYFISIPLLRPQGLFLFSTSQAVALAVAIPLFMAMAAWYRRWRWPLRALAAAGGVVLVATTTRGAMLALAVSIVAVWLARRWTIGYISIPLNRRSAFIFAAGSLVVILLAVATGAAQPFTRLITARIFDSRTSLYEVTVQRWVDSPFLGWGTEVDYSPSPKPTAKPTPSPTPKPSPSPKPSPTATPIPRPQDNPPLGSHSQYLGVLFKQGLVGALFFVAIMWIVAAQAVRVFRRSRPGTDWVVVAFGASLLAAITESLWLDPGTALVVGICWD